MLIVASSPLLRQQRADDKHPGIVIIPPTRHRPATAPLDKILGIDKRHQTTYGVWQWRAAVASEVVAAGSGGVRLFSKGRHVEGGDEKICQRYART